LFRAAFQIDLVLLRAPAGGLRTPLRAAAAWNPEQGNHCEQAA
jgi:hypothetical protein